MNEHVEKNTKKEKSKINRIRIESCLIGLTLVTGVVGYQVTKDNNFTRIVNENGDYELEGFISYDELKKYNVVEIETITGETKMFIGKNVLFDYYEIKEIFSNKTVRGNVISKISVEPFLVAYDMIKGKYSEDDILELVDKIKDDYENNENFQKVKQQ